MVGKFCSKRGAALSSLDLDPRRHIPWPRVSMESEVWSGQKDGPRLDPAGRCRLFEGDAKECP